MEATRELLWDIARDNMAEMEDADLLAAIQELDIVDLGELSVIALESNLASKEPRALPEVLFTRRQPMGRSRTTFRRLSSGLGIIHLPLAGMNTVSLGLLSGAGARLEAEDEIGSSRILEHWIWRREQKEEDLNDILADFGANLKTSSNIEWTRHWTTVLCDQFEPVFKLFLHDILEFDLCPETFAASKEYAAVLSSKRRKEPNAYVMDVLREKMSGVKRSDGQL